MKSRVYLFLGMVGVMLLTLFSLKPMLLRTCIALIQLNPSSATAPIPADIPIIEPGPSPTVSPPTPPQTITTQNPVEGAQGALRVSNPTSYPVRVALLSRTSNDAVMVSPVHWDFAPQEGSQTGLLLSLPDHDLTLQPGDVLVGFAQDGSRRYWGPYIVGETHFPVWNATGQEWQLILQP